MAEPAGRLKCVVVTPERAVLDETADFIALPMFDGELGVLPGRAALIGRLGSGELRIRKDGISHRYYVDGGFAQVRSNVVTVLTSRASDAANIDVEAARRLLATPKAGKPGPEAQQAHHREQAKARARIRIAQRGS